VIRPLASSQGRVPRTFDGFTRPGDGWWLLGAATIFLAQQVGIRAADPDGWEGELRRGVFVVSTAALVILALRFRRFWGAWLIAAGIVMNLVPMSIHRGSMPIDYEVLRSSGAFPEIGPDRIGNRTSDGKDVVLERGDIRFYALSDRYVVDLPLYGTNVYSAGDFVLFGGAALVVVQAGAWLVLPPLRERRPKPSET
jgi:hypothetical protein